MLGCAIAGHSLRGELAEARAGLTKNVPTNSLVSMAIDRRHAALWPELDRLGADRYRKNLEHEANRAATAAKTAPKDYAVATHQMRTLRALGRFQEALGVGKHLAADKAQIEIVGSDAFWLVNEYANDLRYQGHIDDAIVALDNVLALGVDRYPELGSLVINRSEMAIAAGHFQKAFDDLTELERKRFDHLSAYGKMWVWANQACALWGLGRDDEAKAVAGKLSSKAEDNWNAAATAAACHGDGKAIADMLIKRLRDSDARSDALGLFLVFDTQEERTPFEIAMRRTMADARGRPEVQAELAKYGRSIHYAGTTAGWSEF